MKHFKWLGKLISNWRNPIKKSIDTKEIRRILLGLFYINEWRYQTTITKIEAFELKDSSIELIITTHRPGVLIGKAGSFLKELEFCLSKELDKKVKILIIEDNLWLNLYKEIKIIQ